MTGTGLPVTVALPDYHHTAEIAAGVVELAGMAPTFVDDTASDPDIADIPLAKYVSRRLDGDDTLIAVPVFPARAFVHSWIHVAEPSARMAEPSATAAVYARGVLTDPGGATRAAIPPTSRVLVIPPATAAGAPGLRPLFADPGEAERSDYARTGVYPILSVIGVRADLLARERWLAGNVYRAFEVARRRYFARLQDIRGSRAPIPSIAGHLRVLTDLFGPDPWPYGLEPNRATLETFLGHAARQGVIARTPDDIGELFAFAEPFVDYTDGM